MEGQLPPGHLTLARDAAECHSCLPISTDNSLSHSKDSQEFLELVNRL